MFFRTLFIIFFIIFSTVSQVSAQTPKSKTFAVLPCQVNGPKQYRYLSKGIQSMLISRLTWQKHFEPQSSQELKNLQPPTTKDQAQKMVRSIKSDYLIWESITIVGKQTSFDLSMISEQGKMISQDWHGPIDRLIPYLESVAQKINAQVFKKPTAHDKKGHVTKKTKKESLNPSVIYSDQRSKQKKSLNPRFRYSETGKQSGRWRSQSLSYSGLGMVVCDADADGQNEIFILDEQRLRAYRIHQNRLKKLAEYMPGSRIQCVYINNMDINRDGYQDLLISAFEEKTLKSFILNFKDQQFIEKEKEIPFYLNALRKPPEYMKVLIGQKRSENRLFDGNIHEVLHMSEGYSLGRQLSLPQQANVFNFTYLPQKDNQTLKIIADKQDHLKVCSESNKILFTTENTYAASGNKLLISSTLPGLKGSPHDPEQFYYIPTRLIPCNLDKNNRFELLVNKNTSVASQFFKRYRHFPQSSIQNLYWDGVGLNIYWKTRAIKGSVVDYGLADIDNDDTVDLYVCLNTHPGASGFRARKTVVLSYPLNLDSKIKKGQIIKPAK